MGTGLRAGATSALLLATAALGACSQPPAVPGVLLITADTLRADKLGCYGYDRPTSPNLDRFASRALLFTDVLAQSSTTAPSHRSLFSGRFVYQHRNTLERIPVMAGLLSRAGYQTAAFVDGGQMRPQFGFSKGFASYVTTNGRHLAGAQVGGEPLSLGCHHVEHPRAPSTRRWPRSSRAAGWSRSAKRARARNSAAQLPSLPMA